MNIQTVHLLNQLNRLFYQTVASSFDATRGTAWQGWEVLLPVLKGIGAEPLEVLDIGCGNGRFGTFLQESSLNFDYTGIDNNAYLLERASTVLEQSGIAYHLEQGDILEGYTPKKSYDAVTLFGVMHHIPGFEMRYQILRKALGWLKPGGLLVVTFWLFCEQESLKTRIVDWSDDRVPEAFRNLDLEENDFLLEWRRENYALRYCHYVDEEEGERLLAGLGRAADFRADNSNRYVVLRAE